MSLRASGVTFIRMPQPAESASKAVQPFMALSSTRNDVIPSLLTEATTAGAGAGTAYTLTDEKIPTAAKISMIIPTIVLISFIVR